MAELLAPAGTLEALDAAFGEGADAVYLGLKSFNARLRSTNFAWSQFEAAVYAAHRIGKKIFVTVNTVLQENETERMYRFLAYLNSVKPDGLIVQDLGVVRMARMFFPDLRIHASTQMNIASARAANAMSRDGLKRVVLARELSLSEIQDIRHQTNIELEVFIHGALCISESGLCLFSSYLGGKSANRGLCAQACRRLYTAEQNGSVQQGYFFSPNDLQLVDYIPDLVQAGVNSFKIEGRMKSAEYVGTVVAGYRYLLDNWESDKKGSIATAKRILANDFARQKTVYWYASPDKKTVEASQFLNPRQAGGTGIYLGKIASAKKDGDAIMADLSGNGYNPQEGDSIRLHKADDSQRESHKIKHIEERPGGGIRIDIPEGFGTGDNVYLIQMKTIGRRYERFLPRDLSPFRKQPGAQKLPRPQEIDTLPDMPETLPEGLYMQVSTIKDMFAVQNHKPVRIILEINTETVAALTGDAPLVLPFAKRNIILSLDPYLPQLIADEQEALVTTLTQKGYHTWIVNNPGQIAMAKQQGNTVIAGPYLYTFNRWSLDWLHSRDIFPVITPLENSKDNLEQSVDSNMRKYTFVTIFAYPALFRMRFKLPDSYDFIWFSDRQEGEFKILKSPDGSFVLPEDPFSLLDKANALHSDGFKRLIIDFSKTDVSRAMFKSVMDAYDKGKVLPETTRFNWKEGFYSPDRAEYIAAVNSRNAAESAKKTINKGQGKPIGKRTAQKADSTSKQGKPYHTSKTGQTGRRSTGSAGTKKQSGSKR